MLIYVDIDETICYHPTHSSGKRNYNHAKPYSERIAKINDLYDQGNTIVYWTARGTMTGINWFEITHSQLISWGAKFHELRMGKPAYDLFIDDKNINSDVYFAEETLAIL
jgi:hypothetical protein